MGDQFRWWASIVGLMALAGPILHAEEFGPPHSYVAASVCPYECCRYGAWTAQEDMPLFNHPDGEIAGPGLSKGDHVEAVDGEIHVTPTRAQVITTNLESDDVRSGDMVYVLYPLGHDRWALWHRGREVAGSPGDLRLIDRPKEWVWWIQIQTADHQTAWARHAGRPHQVTKVPFSGWCDCCERPTAHS